MTPKDWTAVVIVVIIAIALAVGLSLWFADGAGGLLPGIGDEEVGALRDEVAVDLDKKYDKAGGPIGGDVKIEGKTVAEGEMDLLDPLNIGKKLGVYYFTVDTSGNVTSSGNLYVGGISELQAVVAGTLDVLGNADVSGETKTNTLKVNDSATINNWLYILAPNTPPGQASFRVNDMLATTDSTLQVNAIEVLSANRLTFGDPVAFLKGADVYERLNVYGDLYVYGKSFHEGEEQFAIIDVTEYIYNSQGDLTVADDMVVEGETDFQDVIYSTTGDLIVDDNLYVNEDLTVEGVSDFQDYIYNSEGILEIQDSLTQTGGGQVAFSGNVDMFNGLDVWGDTNTQNIYPHSTCTYSLGSDELRWYDIYANNSVNVAGVDPILGTTGTAILTANMLGLFNEADGGTMLGTPWGVGASPDFMEDFEQFAFMGSVDENTQLPAMIEDIVGASGYDYGNFIIFDFENNDFTLANPDELYDRAVLGELSGGDINILPNSGYMYTYNVLPDESCIYDLGSDDLRWRDLYLNRRATIEDWVGGTWYESTWTAAKFTLTNYTNENNVNLRPAGLHVYDQLDQVVELFVGTDGTTPNTVEGRNADLYLRTAGGYDIYMLPSSGRTYSRNFRPNSTTGQYNLGSSNYYWNTLWAQYLDFNGSQYLQPTTLNLLPDGGNTYSYNFLPYSTNTYNLGSAANYWKYIYEDVIYDGSNPALYWMSMDSSSFLNNLFAAVYYDLDERGGPQLHYINPNGNSQLQQLVVHDTLDVQNYLFNTGAQPLLVNDNLRVSGWIDAQNYLGNTTGDLIVRDNILPYNDSAWDLGASGMEWANLWVDDIHIMGSSEHWGPEDYFNDVVFYDPSGVSPIMSVNSTGFDGIGFGSNYEVSIDGDLKVTGVIDPILVVVADGGAEARYYADGFITNDAVGAEAAFGIGGGYAIDSFFDVFMSLPSGFGHADNLTGAIANLNSKGLMIDSTGGGTSYSRIDSGGGYAIDSFFDVWFDVEEGLGHEDLNTGYYAQLAADGLLLENGVGQGAFLGVEGDGSFWIDSFFDVYLDAGAGGFVKADTILPMGTGRDLGSVIDEWDNAWIDTVHTFYLEPKDTSGMIGAGTPFLYGNFVNLDVTNLNAANLMMTNLTVTGTSDLQGSVLNSTGPLIIADHLRVTGDTTIAADFRVNNNASVAGNFRANADVFFTSPSSDTLRFGNAGGKDNIIITDNNWSITGPGVATFSYLNVSGDTTMQGLLNVDNVFFVDSGGNAGGYAGKEVTIVGDLEVTGNLDPVDIIYTGVLSGPVANFTTLTATNVSIGSLGDTTVSGNLVVTGTSDFRNSIFSSTGYLDINDSVQAPVFFDRDNNNYFLDPASTSFLSDIIFHYGSAYRYYDRENESYYLDPASTSYLSDIYSNNNYAYRYYDRDDSSYYIDPASTSRMNIIDVYNAGYIYDSSNDLTLNDNVNITGNLYDSGGDLYINDNVGITGYLYDSNSALMINDSVLPNSTGGAFDLGSSTYYWDELYATIFRDANNPTSYYVDPASTSYLYNVSTNYTYASRFIDTSAATYYVTPAGSSIVNNLDIRGSIYNNAGTLTIADLLSQTGGGQVSFSGNVDAGSGLDVTGALTVSGSISDSDSADLTVNDGLIVGGNVAFSGALSDTDSADVTINDGLIVGGNVALSGVISDSDSAEVTVNDGLIVTGSTTLQNGLQLDGNLSSADGTVTVSASLVPSADGTYLLGTSANEWKEGWIDKVYTYSLETKDTSSTIGTPADPFWKGNFVDLEVAGDLSVGGSLTFNTTVTVGATLLTEDIIPQGGGLYDLGDITNYWNWAYIAKIQGDYISVDYLEPVDSSASMVGSAGAPFYEGYFGTIYTDTLDLSGHIRANSDVAGVVTIPGGGNTVTYNFSSSYTTAPVVVVTPKANPPSNYWVTSETTSFTVRLGAGTFSNLDFNYIVMEP